MANTTVAYILWFFLGIFGVHHFYLHRDRHAFLLWCTLGGCFGLGWLRDLFHLPDYVEECNADNGAYVSDDVNIYSQNRQRRDGRVKVSMARFCGMMVMGMNLGYLVTAACPSEWFYRADVIGFILRFVFPILATAVGVHMVANIGSLQATMTYPLVGAAVGGIWLLSDPSNVTSVSFFSSIFTWLGGISWRQQPKRRRGVCIRVSRLAFFGTIYLMMWGSSVYFNAKVVTKDGERIPLRVALNNFFTSPAWTETKEAFDRVWEQAHARGWDKLFEELVVIFDPEGENSAYKALGLDENAGQDEIKARYRKLAKEWHPDKHKDPVKKQEAQAKFIEIQEAYERLSAIRARRQQQNMKSTTTTTSTKAPEPQHTEF